MGNLLSDVGIGPSETNVDAVRKTKKPENAKEVRSFLGLVNFCAKFIPGLATVSEPLLRLTRQNVPFRWGPSRINRSQRLNVDSETLECLHILTKMQRQL